MSFRTLLADFSSYLKNREQTRLIERAYCAVNKSGWRQGAVRDKALREAQSIFEKLDFERDPAFWAIFDAWNEEEFKFSPGPLPEGLAEALARGVSKQGPAAMDALASRLENISALAAAGPNRWGGSGSMEALQALCKLRPEAERRAIEESTGKPQTKRSGASRL